MPFPKYIDTAVHKYFNQLVESVEKSNCCHLTLEGKSFLYHNLNQSDKSFPKRYVCGQVHQIKTIEEFDHDDFVRKKTFVTSR